MKTAILTDSGCNLPKAYIEKSKNLFVIPLIINIDDESFRDQLEITSEEIYRDLDEKNIKTSLPKTGDLHDIFTKVKKKDMKDYLSLTFLQDYQGLLMLLELKLNKKKI
jgi:fatty acid-binding protein DegV